MHIHICFTVVFAGALAAQHWQTTSALPQARSSCGLTYQVASGRVLLFGGSDAGAFPLGDTWDFDGVTWRQLAITSSPPARTAPAMTYDIARSRVVLFGGNTVAGTREDTWEFDGASWRQILVAGPPHRSGTMTYDSARRRCVIYGGFQLPVIAVLADTWEFDGAAWIRIATPGNTPGARTGHCMTYDAARGTVVLFGGSGPQGITADTWEYDGRAWTQVPIAGPPARHGAAMTFDVQSGRAVLFGGRDLNQFADTWEYDGTWHLVQATSPPAARYLGSLCYDLRRGHPILFGGQGSSFSAVIPGVSEFAPADSPTWTRYGVGCNGSHGAPTLDGAPGSTPQIGSTFVMHMGQLPVPPAIAFLWFGFDFAQRSGAPLPLALDAFGVPGCLLWVDVATDPITLQHTGTAIATLSIPADVALRGTVLGAQALVGDVAGGIIMSNGIAMRVF